jgi:hypothetical protein
MNHQFLGREGVLDDTKPTQHEAVFRKLKNNELEILKNNKAFYHKLKQNVAQGEQQ